MFALSAGICKWCSFTVAQFLRLVVTTVDKDPGVRESQKQEHTEKHKKKQA